MNSHDFESALGQGLRHLAASGVRPVDPLSAAQAAVEVGARRWVGPWVRWPSPRTLRALWLAGLVALLLLAVAAALYVGLRPVVVAPPPLQRLALVSGGDLYSTDTDHTTLSLVARQGTIEPVLGPLEDFNGARWSPDGSHIEVRVGQQFGDPLDHGLAVYSTAGNLTGFDPAVTGFGWAPEGDRLIASPLNFDIQKPASLDVVSLAAAITSVPFPQKGQPLAMEWTTDGNVIVVWQHLEPAVPGGQSVQPDAANTDSVWLVDPSAAESAQELGVLHGAVLAAISPDRMSIAVVTADSLGGPTRELEVIGTDAHVVCSMPTSTLEGDPTAVVWSPDGRRLAVGTRTSEGSALWVIPATCKAPTAPLVSGATTGLTLDDSALLAAASDEPLRIVSGEAVGGPIEFSADGRWIYYRGLAASDQVATGINHLDLRRVSANGGPSQLLISRVEWFDLTDGAP